MIRKAAEKGMYGRGAAGDPEAVGPGRGILVRVGDATECVPAAVSERNPLKSILPLVNGVNKW
ncbi:hypothetical protein, partial [Bacillus siamensis]|uniref:hypothetical protein n=1 Tax=Bacillus siamensis TaxID=659243 RepID=UPI0039E09943